MAQNQDEGDDHDLDNTGERMVPAKTYYTVFWEHIYRYRFACQYVKNKRVLDIACGEGYGTAALEKAGASSVIGIDISPQACENATRKYGVNTIVGDASQIPLPNSSVDIVVSFETIEHVSEPRKFIEECVRILHPKGTLIVSTPNKPVYDISSPSNPFHCSEMDYLEFSTLLKNYFSSYEIFTQITHRASILSPRFILAQRYCGRYIRGTHMVRNFIHDLLCLNVPSNYRHRPVDTILSNEKPFFKYLNPYKVRTRQERETTTYLIAVASL